MTEEKRMKYAQKYLTDLANGINPLDGSKITQTDIVNNKHISNCLAYVANVLDKLNNAKSIPKKSKKAERLDIPYILDHYQFVDRNIRISEVSCRINEAKNPNTPNVKSLMINNWLIQKGYLTYVEYGNKKRRYPTQAGEVAGIVCETLTGKYGQYTIPLYNKEIQHLIIENLEEIVETGIEDKLKHKTMLRRPWLPEEEQKLTEMFQNGISLKEMASTFNRSTYHIRIKLFEMRLIASKKDI